MRKKLFLVLLSLCLLFVCSLSALAAPVPEDDPLLDQYTNVGFTYQGSALPVNVTAFDLNSAVLQWDYANTYESGEFYYDDTLESYYTSSTGYIRELPSSSEIGVRVSGTTSFYVTADLPDLFDNTYGSGTIRLNLTFGGLNYSYRAANGSATTASVSNPRLQVVGAQLVTATGQTYDGGIISSGSATSTASINYRFNDAGLGTGNEYLKVTVQFSFYITNAGQYQSLSASTLMNGYARFNLASASGYVDLDSAYANVSDFNNRFSSGLESVMESQNEELKNGYDNSSGENANSDLQSGLSSYESEEAQAHQDFSDKMDSYEAPDTTQYISGVTFVASCVTSWWNALGLFQGVLLVAFALIIFNFISRYRGGG